MERTIQANCNSNKAGVPTPGKSDETDTGVARSTVRWGKQPQQDRSALIDITNDSPIVGLAAGSIIATPSSLIAKRRSYQCKQITPGSGEDLLRGQVKTLLQKVEDDGKISNVNYPFLQHKSIASSQLELLAPTPAKTPAFLSCPSNQLKEDQADVISSENVVTRSLLMDFSDKHGDSSSDCPSALSFQRVGEEGEGKERVGSEDDDGSIWSVQVNTSRDEDEEDDDEVDSEAKGEGWDVIDELCRGMAKVAVGTGKHTRFVYDSDDEIVGGIVVNSGPPECASSPGVLRLKGLPSPQGKHLRFPEDEIVEETVGMDVEGQK